MSVKERLETYVKYKKLSNSAFCRSIGVSAAFISSMRVSLQPDKAESIALRYPDLNISWLLTGSGEMLNTESNAVNENKEYSVGEFANNIVSQPDTAKAVLSTDGIPLITIDAVAGFANGDRTAMSYDVTENYLVPEFQVRGVEFLIRASGSSMYPKYSNGDILACRPIKDLTFFQWGKVYVLDTDQGALVKRLFEGKDDAFIECRSDNKEHYPAFQIPKTSIRSISIVVGVIRLD